MQFARRFSRGQLPLNRLEAFSDGVFAIIVTLLVLELKTPELHDAHSARELGDQLIELVPKFFSWLISFVIVCKFWLNHHYVLRLARHANYALIWLNSIFLMFQSFVPFPTALMGEYPHNPLAVSFFGMVMAFNTTIFIILHRYILHHLLRPEYSHENAPDFLSKSAVGPLAYLIGAGAAWLSVYLAFVAYVITPLFYIVPRHINPPSADQ